MSRLTKTVSGRIGFLGCLCLLVSCAPRVATSFWRIGTPADSVKEGYAVLHEGTKIRHCYPVTEWTDTANSKSDSYRQFHHHGVAVESEQMAYRVYFDKKQTIDVYCKRTPQLELATSYWYPDDSLLHAGYGDDILRVGGSVGVGTVKYWDGRLHHFDRVAQRSERIVRQTRRSATIEIVDKGWQPPTANSQLPTAPVDLTVRYTLRAGHRDMRCDVFASDWVEGLCTGVQSIPVNSQLPTANSQWLHEQLPNGILLASWGTDWPVNDTVKYAKETVGIAVFIPAPYAGTLVQDKSNNLCLLNCQRLTANSRQPAECTAHFYLTVCGATKENHPVATNATEWFDYLRRWAKTLK